jgi:Tfp pilus assembly protein PilN
MLRTNLSTRPFYNVRAVQVAIGLLAAIVLILSAYNVVEIIRLTGAQQSLGARASEYEEQAAQMRQEAAQLRAKVDPKELEIVAAAAREANTVIDQRVFSWTDLMTQFEATLPEDVRITAVSPRTDRERLIIGVAVEARTFEDLDAFVEALEETGNFRDVLPVEQRLNDDGLVEAIVEGVYTQSTRDVDPALANDQAAPEGATP